jgi:hypothetical protein
MLDVTKIDPEVMALLATHLRGDAIGATLTDEEVAKVVAGMTPRMAYARALAEMGLGAGLPDLTIRALDSLRAAQVRITTTTPMEPDPLNPPITILAGQVWTYTDKGRAHRLEVLSVSPGEPAEARVLLGAIGEMAHEAIIPTRVIGWAMHAWSARLNRDPEPWPAFAPGQLWAYLFNGDWFLCKIESLDGDIVRNTGSLLSPHGLDWQPRKDYAHDLETHLHRCSGICLYTPPAAPAEEEPAVHSWEDDLPDLDPDWDAVSALVELEDPHGERRLFVLRSRYNTYMDRYTWDTSKVEGTGWSYVRSQFFAGEWPE